MLCDTHCHIYGEYYDNIDEIIKRAKASGVAHYIVNGCDGNSNRETFGLAKDRAEVFACLGIHPEAVGSYQQKDLDFITLHASDDKVIGIGEIGLDYHYSKDNKEEQKRLFESQLKIAEKFDLPVVIHSREATEDTINILKRYPNVKGVIHSFTLSIEVANIYIKMGYKLGINGVVTFKNSHLKEIIPDILPNIILETDSPYLTPHPYRGEKNEPKYIKDIALFIGELTGKSLGEIEDITNSNIKEVFKIDFLS